MNTVYYEITKSAANTGFVEEAEAIVREIVDEDFNFSDLLNIFETEDVASAAVEAGVDEVFR